MLKLISIDRKRINIAMLNKLLSILAGLSVVKSAVSINALWSILQKGVAKYITGIIMDVIPYKWNSHAIIILECILLDCSSIGAA
jgi:hypothetical protein